MSQRIEFDYNNMMSENIGTRMGITEERLRSFEKITKKAHDDMTKRRQSKELPFYDLPYQTGLTDAIKSAAKEYMARYDTQVVIGIGGSALGPLSLLTALRNSFWNELPASKRNGMRTYVTDNIDPDWTKELLEMIDPKKTLFLVVTKSGSTSETITTFFILQKFLIEAVGEAEYREHICFVTDPNKSILREIADKENIRWFPIEPLVGGRFSVLTPVGVLPAALMGIDVDKLLAGAAEMDKWTSSPELEKNPAYLFAALQYLAYQNGAPISVLMPYSNKLARLADWYVQLWAESLGKKFTLDGNIHFQGPTPLKAVGATDQHSQVQLFKEGPYDKVVTFIRVKDFDCELEIPKLYGEYKGISYLSGHTMNELIDSEQKATEAALSKEGRPSITITVPKVDEFTMGQLIYMFEVATVFSGYLYQLDPLDQPGVEEGKNFTYGLLGRAGYEDKKKEFDGIYKKNKKFML
ncbi:MAG: glucose-6-phosphate isomerase [Brevinematales bacterium]|nr:glucose-6-phosphate isomerase [Brevinematales bacterium]